MVQESRRIRRDDAQPQPLHARHADVRDRLGRGGGPGDPGTPLEYSNILALEGLYPGTFEWNTTALSPHYSYVDPVGVHHEVWYTDKQSIGLRAELAVSLGLGVGLWRLGNEDQGVWELPQLGGEG